MQDIVNLISTPRLLIYKDYFKCIDDNEAVGMYLWSQKVNSEFNSIIQIIEVALRNAIVNAYESREEEDLDKYWLSNFFKKMPEENKSRISIENVEYKLSGRPKGFDKDDVVSGLTFGFWTAICSEDHNDSKENSLKLWPSLANEVFKSIGDNDILYVFDLIKDVNIMRNKVSHHEVLWKDFSSIGLESIFNTVAEKYYKCLELAYFINDKNLKLVEIINGVKNIKELCSEKSVINYKNILHEWNSIEGVNLDNFRDDMIKSLEVEGEIVNIGTQYIHVVCEKHRNKDNKLIRFTVDEYEKIKLLGRNVGDRIAFTPSVVRRKDRKLYFAKKISVIR